VVSSLAISADSPVEPVGVWNCVVYGDPARGNERTSLALTPLSAVYWATQGSGGVTAWRRLGDWEQRRRGFSFADVREGRVYEADLERSTLGGKWSGLRKGGGWWCARRPEDLLEVQLDFGRATPEFYVPPLVSNSMDSPRYPIEAIRQAREGHAIVCFLVDSSGQVLDPEVIEITDPLFLATTINAVQRSSYLPSSRVDFSRPGCRDISYTLDMIAY
jgi:hypothetical protein